MSQKKEKYARSLIRRVDALEAQMRDLSRQPHVEAVNRPKPKRRLAPAVLELAVVLLITALAFAWGKQSGQSERGYAAIGGEYLLLLLPAMYYPCKRTILDWIAEMKKVKQ